MPEPTSITNADGSITTTTINADGTKASTTVAATKQPDLMTRVSGFKPTTTTTATTTQTDAEKLGLTQEDWQTVQGNPSLKKYYNSMLADYTKKTQEVSDRQKQFDTLQAKYTNWTPERINELLSDPQFVNAARQVEAQKAPANSGMSDTEWSALSDKEKAKFGQLEARQKELETKQKQSELLIQNERIAMEDTKLKAKYADYAPDIVNTTVSNLLTGKVNATREDIWKVINHDVNVDRAYQLGIQDGMSKASVRQASTTATTDSYTTRTAETIPEIKKGQSDRDYFKELVMNRLSQKTAATK